MKTCLRTCLEVFYYYFLNYLILTIDQNRGDFWVIVRDLRALMTKYPLKQVQGSILSFFCFISLVDPKRFVFACVGPSFEPVVVITVWGELKHMLNRSWNRLYSWSATLTSVDSIYYPETEICVFMIQFLFFIFVDCISWWIIILTIYIF